MKKLKILATILAVQMLGTLVTGCQTDSKDSNLLDKVESQVEKEVQSESNVETESDVESTSEIAEEADSNEESTEAEETEYVPNPDNYTVYVNVKGLIDIDKEI